MKVSLKDDSLPDGTELYVRGLGTLINGGSVEFSDEEVEAFEAERDLPLEEAFANDPRINVGKASKLPPADDRKEDS
jgi:hypothetical protein